MYVYVKLLDENETVHDNLHQDIVECKKDFEVLRHSDQEELEKKCPKYEKKLDEEFKSNSLVTLTLKVLHFTSLNSTKVKILTEKTLEEGATPSKS